LGGNTQLLTQAIQQAAAAGAEWILTPELALSGYRFTLAISAVAYQGKHQVEHQNSGNSILLVEWDFETQTLVSQRSFELMAE